MNALLYFLVVVIWGTTWVAIAMQQGVVSVPVSIFWRFAIASSLLLISLKLLGRLKTLAFKDHLFCVLQGACVFGFNFFCFYYASFWINTGLESVIFSMAVLFNTFNSFVFFARKPSRRIFPSALLGISGVVALFWHELSGQTFSQPMLYGILLSALGTFGFSLGNMISLRHQSHKLDLFTTNGYAMLYGTLIMGAIALARGDNFVPEATLRYLGSLLYLAIFGSVIAFSAYFSLVRRIGANKAAYSTLLFPPVALLLSTLYEGYVWHLNAGIGIVLILAGNLVMFYQPAQRVKRPVQQA